MRALCLLLFLATWLGAQDSEAHPPAPAALRVLLLDGQNNHDGPRTTKLLRAALDTHERFVVQTLSTPPKGAPEEAWKAFRPPFAKFDAVLLNYNGEAWPTEVRTQFLAWIEAGGGVVAVHASNNAFPGWLAYDRLIALGWRGADYGRRVIVDDMTGKPILQPIGEGRGAGHGRVHAFRVKVRAPEHPIMRGLPAQWKHGADELYHGQRGPAEGFHLLSSAWSDPKTGGSGKHEPITWWTGHGKGRFVTTVLGHLWKGQRAEDSLRCVGFRTVVARALEWSATGKVTIPVPENFPDEDRVRLAPAK